MRPATEVKIEHAARLALLGYKGAAIADAVQLSYKGLESLRSRPEYKTRIAQLQKEAIECMEAAYNDKMRARFRRVFKNPLDTL